MPDFRHNRGKRHALTAMLALACSAMLCGYRRYTAIAAWGRNYGAHLMQALGAGRVVTMDAMVTQRAIAQQSVAATMLVIDDDASIVRALTRLLRRDGRAVQAAGQ